MLLPSSEQRAYLVRGIHEQCYLCLNVSLCCFWWHLQAFCCCCLGINCDAEMRKADIEMWAWCSEAIAASFTACVVLGVDAVVRKLF